MMESNQYLLFNKLDKQDRCILAEEDKETMNTITPIVIPVYEPGENFQTMIRILSEQTSQKIIVVDDGSGKKYEKIFNEVRQLKNVIVLVHVENLGKGRSLKDTFNYILYKFPDAMGVVTADSDGQHMIRDIINCKDNLVRNYNCLILGCRKFDRNKVPWKSRVGNDLTRRLFKYLCGIKISDTQTGLRGIPRSLMHECLTIKGERFDYETNVLLKANENYDLIEIPIETIYDSRQAHKTHFDPFRDSLMIYQSIFSYTLSSFLAVLVDFTIFSLSTKSGINLWIAMALGRLGSTTINFSINRKAVFKTEGDILMQLLRYLLLVLVSGVVSAMMISVLSRILSGRIIILKAVVEGILFFFNYYVQHNYVFGNRCR
ncbi:MAG: glycosyltransferase [Hungatella sp.]|nr:glycosyltransferase [Hungatella sp.]